MKHLRRQLVFGLILACYMGSRVQAAEPSVATAPEVWISSNDPTHGGAPDFWAMFEPGAPWAKAMGRITGVSIAQNLVTNGPPDKLRTFYAFLKQNHLQLAVSIGMLTWSDTCGKHVEGYVPPGGSDYVARRIKALGGELSYVDIDEAFWFGRYYAGPRACHGAIDALAADVAANFDAYRRVFPAVQLSDTEPLGPPPSGDPTGHWASETQTWLDAIQAHTGVHLASVHEDITNWERPLADYLPAVATLVRRNHIAFAPIIIAASSHGPDAAWMASAEHNIALLRTSVAWPPDQVVFATWHAFPTRNLPDTAPDAFTYLVNYYFEAQ